jgi:hypothetical protein
MRHEVRSMKIQNSEFRSQKMQMFNPQYSMLNTQCEAEGATLI